MPINLAYLEMRLSGGATNTDPKVSLGGASSSKVIRSKLVTGVSNITGVVLDDAPGSADGAGTLAFTAADKSFIWTPASGSAGSAVQVTTAGRYAIPGSAGYLFITIADTTALPSANKTDTISVTQLANELFDDISKSESFDGDVEYRCFYLHNAHPTDPFIGAKVFIGAQPNGTDSLMIALDPAGVAGAAATVANESTAPGPGITFSAPASINSSLLMGEIKAGEGYPIWQQRTVPQNSLTSVAADISSLAFNVGY